MARNIQSGGGSEANLKTFVGLLANAIFWIVVAVVFPVRLIPELVLALAPYAQWAPAIFYALAIWSFVRSVRSLQRLATGRRGSASGDGRRRPAPAEDRLLSGGSARLAAQGGAKSAASDRGLPPIHRKPTVRRVR
ncbi:MAG: hypothetical protein ACREEP_00360 [Dongiaceae bacterium]